jgi:hypothetical protein
MDWPLYVFLRHSVVLEPLAWHWSLFGITASFGLAYLSWRFVEQPFRGRRIAPAERQIGALTAAAGAVFLAAGLSGHAAEGLPQRVGDIELVRPVPRPAFPCAADRYLADAACRNPSATAPHALLWGDSFARHYVSGLNAHRAELPVGVAYIRSQAAPRSLASTR